MQPLGYVKTNYLVILSWGCGLFVGFSLGRSHYIVWSTRSSDVVKLCPTRKKTWHFVFIFFFPPTWPKNQGIFSRKLYKSLWNLLIFTHKSNFWTFFYFFLRPGAKRKFLFLFFSLRQRIKDPCWSSSTKQYSECGLTSIVSLYL